MPAREKKSIRNAPTTEQKNSHEVERAFGKAPGNRSFSPGNSTRINAFVSSQAKRNQAKRDAR